MNRTQSQSRTRRAFTLIELLVVILILAVLAAMIVPQYFQRIDDAKRAKAQSDLSTLGKLLQTFRMDTGRYPTSEEGLMALESDPGDATGWRGPYTTNPIPLDPWSNNYVYSFPGPNGDESYLLMSYGADNVEGGEGNSKDIVEGAVAQ